MGLPFVVLVVFGSILASPWFRGCFSFLRCLLVMKIKGEICSKGHENRMRRHFEIYPKILAIKWPLFTQHEHLLLRKISVIHLLGRAYNG